MNKKIKVFAITIAVVALIVVPLLLAQKGPTKKAGKSFVGQLYLVEKDPSDWSIVEDGAWGQMTYQIGKAKLWSFFNGHGLEPGWNYTLIYYPDYEGNPWPRVNIVCLGSGIANAGGQVHIQSSTDWDFRDELEDNYPCAKIWLVVSDDINCDSSTMYGWRPTEYLFEFNLIFCDD